VAGRVDHGRTEGIPRGSGTGDLAGRFGSEHHPAGATIVEEGEQGDKLYVIVRGTVDVLQAGPDGVERLLQVMHVGDFFGAIPLIDNVPRTATVRARTACLLLVLSREEFLDVVRASPALRALFEHAAQARRHDPRSSASHD